MMNIKNAFLLSAILFPPAYAVAADTSTAVFDSRFRTLTTRLEGAFMLPPVARLGTSDRIDISFDEIGDDYSRLRYRLLHCNADWQPSKLLESEYLRGFNEAEVDDYAFSSNTYVHYVNYHILIPNDNMQPIASGNYLLQVYDFDNPDDVLLQTRFSVSETAVPVAVTADGRTDKGFNSEYQQVRFALETSAFPIANPFQDLAVTVEQNNNPESMRTVSHPLRVDGTEIVFDHDMNLVYDASNEFRRFETVRVDYPGMHTDSIVWGGSNYHAYLTPDSPRDFSDYSYDSTQHGRFLVDEYNATDPDLGADYVTVHFTLDMPEVAGGDVYVDGDLSLHARGSANRMTYNHQERRYELQMPLKQGSYNYRYVVKSRKPDVMATDAPIEGNKYETRNEYLVKVFHRPAGARADRLVGYGLNVAQ